MHWFKRALSKLRCQAGRHVGANFCAYCGCKLVDTPFFPFRVTNRATGSIDTVHGRNIAHVRKLIGDVEHAMDIQRMPLP